MFWLCKIKLWSIPKMESIPGIGEAEEQLEQMILFNF